jgi:integrase
MTRLSGILQIAVEHGHIPANPARAMRKVAAEPRDEVRPLSPIELEALIAAFDRRDRAITLFGGHLGLRPMEIRLAPWGNLTDAGLVVGRARTKRAAARTRVLALPAATALDLKRWRLESRAPG